ncbi:PilW family protein [Demequina maris]|uniref:PilW family protein n=1 Tax=Demequina maris TaxID=1638982 RepID=UPI00078584FA|nr:type II secretion system protein [Demequina maris]
MRRRFEARRVGEDGFTLVELLVSMIIFSIVMALLIGVMISMTYQAQDVLGRQRAVEQARLGLSQIDRQIRSGNLILDPGLDGPAVSGVDYNYSLRIYTQEGGVPKCAQWRVVFYDTSGYGQLEYRTWDPADTSTSTAWSRVASNVRAPSSGTIDPADSTTWPPFWLDPSVASASDAQNIRVTLRLNDPSARDQAKDQVLTSVITGRNTVFGYPTTSCAAYPAP